MAPRIRVRHLAYGLAVLGFALQGCTPVVQAPATSTAVPATTIAAKAASVPDPTATSSPRPTTTAMALTTPVATPSAVPTSTPTTRAPTTTTTGTVSIPGATIEYYDIVGSTERELRTQLDTLGPKDSSGARFDSLTSWYISWHWPVDRNGNCRLADVTVTSQIKVIFPRWIPPRNASPSLVAKWTRYTHALAEHEKGHVDFVVANVPAVAKSIKSATCDTANAAGQAILDRIRQHDIDYDAATNHGATQGARFP